jgi:carbonic anhydrase/acetyltransferase-like protein (isoleucine patch superfamily)
MPTFALDGTSPQLPAAGAYWIAPDASVIGRVTLEEGVGIWFGAVLRGDLESITIGRNSNIQEHCVVHTDAGYPLSVGEGCTIGHRAILHGCLIGQNSLVGMGAMVMNGAVVGEGCLIGAGALIPEGRIIPRGSLVLGMPGKVVRPLTTEEIGRNRVSAAHYVANWKRFSRGLAIDGV